MEFACTIAHVTLHFLMVFGEKKLLGNGELQGGNSHDSDFLCLHDTNSEDMCVRTRWCTQ